MRILLQRVEYEELTSFYFDSIDSRFDDWFENSNSVGATIEYDYDEWQWFLRFPNPDDALLFKLKGISHLGLK